ncbi:MAG: hypothetical protein AW07_02139 [Candidatus Accumulibacter sp. SK-11]|nr:MAG: hypothetical protein AW07_02139 [Candidatus Accumulibacter sp. SK-11]
MLRTDLRAVTDGGAVEHAFLGIDQFHPLGLAAIPRIDVVAMQQRRRRRSDEARIETKLRAGGIAQQAVDARAELLVGIELLGRLQILALRQRALFLRDDVGLDALEFLDEAFHVDHQITLDREVRQCFDAHPCRVVIAQEGLARQVRNAVDHHAATAADRHPARPAKAQ